MVRTHSSVPLFFTGISMIDYRPRETCVPSHGVLLPRADKSLPSACRSAPSPAAGISPPTRRKRCKQTPPRRLRTRILCQGRSFETRIHPCRRREIATEKTGEFLVQCVSEENRRRATNVFIRAADWENSKGIHLKFGQAQRE